MQVGMRAALAPASMVAMLVALAGEAVGGGFAVREQSASGQGASFAGSAAGGDLSSAFWNPAAFGIAGSGLSSESHFSVIIPGGELNGTATTITGVNIGGATSTERDHVGYVPASYAAYRLTNQLVVGVSSNAPFGLSTEPRNENWAGRTHGRTAKLFTLNVTPTVAYQLAPGFIIGAGAQFEYMSLVFKFASSATPGAQSAVIDLDDNLGVGFTLGGLWQPTRMTSIGLGFRSSVSHELEGKISTPLSSGSASADFDTPELVTLSIRQGITHNTRLLGTVEWSNWSRFDQIPINQSTIVAATAPNGLILDGHWHDGWFFSFGGEWDYSNSLTFRTGVAYERSPIQNASERLPQVTDSDRVWVSAGLTYRLTTHSSMDIGYSHVFFEDAPINRLNLTNTVRLIGNADQHADIVAVSFRTKW